MNIMNEEEQQHYDNDGSGRQPRQKPRPQRHDPPAPPPLQEQVLPPPSGVVVGSASDPDLAAVRTMGPPQPQKPQPQPFPSVPQLPEESFVVGDIGNSQHGSPLVDPSSSSYDSQFYHQQQQQQHQKQQDLSGHYPPRESSYSTTCSMSSVSASSITGSAALSLTLNEQMAAVQQQILLQQQQQQQQQQKDHPQPIPHQQYHHQSQNQSQHHQGASMKPKSKRKSARSKAKSSSNNSASASGSKSAFAGLDDQTPNAGSSLPAFQDFGFGASGYVCHGSGTPHGLLYPPSTGGGGGGASATEETTTTTTTSPRYPSWTGLPHPPVPAPEMTMQAPFSLPGHPGTMPMTSSLTGRDAFVMTHAPIVAASGHGTMGGAHAKKSGIGLGHGKGPPTKKTRSPHSVNTSTTTFEKPTKKKMQRRSTTSSSIKNKEQPMPTNPRVLKRKSSNVSTVSGASSSEATTTSTATTTTTGNTTVAHNNHNSHRNRTMNSNLRSSSNTTNPNGPSSPSASSAPAAPAYVILDDDEDRLVNPLLQTALAVTVSSRSSRSSTSASVSSMTQGGGASMPQASSSSSSSTSMDTTTTMTAGASKASGGGGGGGGGKSSSPLMVGGTTSASSSVTSKKRQKQQGSKGGASSSSSSAAAAQANAAASVSESAMNGSELFLPAELAFCKPDTYPLSYLARLLGFDVPVPSWTETVPALTAAAAAAAATAATTTTTTPKAVPAAVPERAPPSTTADITTIIEHANDSLALSSSVSSTVTSAAAAAAAPSAESQPLSMSLPPFPTPLPDPMTLPFVRQRPGFQDVFLQVPPVTCHFNHPRAHLDDNFPREQQQQHERLALLFQGGDRDDYDTLNEYRDPVYQCLLTDGYRVSTLAVSNNDSLKPTASAWANKFANVLQRNAIQRHGAVVDLARNLFVSTSSLPSSSSSSSSLLQSWTFHDWTSVKHHRTSTSLAAAATGSSTSAMTTTSTTPATTEGAAEASSPMESLSSSRSTKTPLGPATPHGASLSEVTANTPPPPPQRSPPLQPPPLPQWTIDGTNVYHNPTPHSFGIVASYQGRAVAMFQWRFVWYQLPLLSSAMDRTTTTTGATAAAASSSSLETSFALSKRRESELILWMDGMVDLQQQPQQQRQQEKADPRQQPQDEENAVLKAPPQIQANHQVIATAQADTETTKDGIDQSVPPQNKEDLCLTTASSTGLNDKEVRQRSTNVVVPKAIQVIMTALALEHARSCDVWYGLVTAPNAPTVHVYERYFRMGRLEGSSGGPFGGSAAAEAAADHQPGVVPMVCDLKKSSARYALLRFKQDEVEEEQAKKNKTNKLGQAHGKSDIQHSERCLVRMPDVDQANCWLELQKSTLGNSTTKRSAPLSSSMTVSGPAGAASGSVVIVPVAPAAAGSDPAGYRANNKFTSASIQKRNICIGFRVKLLEEGSEGVSHNTNYEQAKTAGVPMDSKVKADEEKDGTPFSPSMEMFRLNEDGTVDETMGDVYESLKRKNRPEDTAQHDEKDGDTGIELTEQMYLDILRSFPLPKTATKGANPSTNNETLEGDLDDEILSQLLAKQKELVAMERAMEPHLRAVLAKVVKERIEYENPEAVHRRAEEKRLLLENEKLVARRKEMDLAWQQQLDQDMDAVCSICNDGEVTPDNQILFCEACNVAVHQRCYGIEEVPEGDYYCISCRHFKRESMSQIIARKMKVANGTAGPPTQKIMPAPPPVSCELCPRKRGAYIKSYVRPADKTSTWKGRRHKFENSVVAPPKPKWVHMVCAKWQGLNFIDGDTEMVEEVTELKQYFRRLQIKCELCQGQQGAYNKCRLEGCSKWMHVTCARASGLCDVSHGENVEGATTENPWTLLCPDHSERPPIDDEDNSTAQRGDFVSIEQLIRAAKDMPVEPPPPPLPADRKPFSKLNGMERRQLLEQDPEYEIEVLEDLTRKLTGVRCEVCDTCEEDGKNLMRCGSCDCVVCISCHSPALDEVDPKFTCLACQVYAEQHGQDSHVAVATEKQLEKASCHLCSQKGGILLLGFANPVSRLSYWKKNPKEFEKTLFARDLWSHTLCSL
jgi:hypothetical protein